MSKYELIKTWGREVTKDELISLRGFVVHSNGQLDPLYHREEDFEYFKWAHENIKKLEESINLNKNANYGMSGPNDFQDENVNGKLICPIPLKFLDPGIALLCKALPLHGISTVYSCSGHRENETWPTISFRRNLDYIKAKDLFREVLKDDFPKVYFSTGRGWMGMKVDFTMESYQEEDYFEAFWFIHNFAKKLISYSRKQSP